MSILHTLKSLATYVWPLPSKFLPEDRLPRASLFLKGLVVLLLELFILLPVGIALFKVLGMGLGILVLIPLSYFAEVLAGAVLLIWYHRSLRTTYAFSILGTVLPTIPLRVAMKIIWSIGWRIWFAKFVVVGLVGLALAIADKIVPFHAAEIITSKTFSKALLSYESYFTILAIYIFLPFINRIYPAYNFTKITGAESQKPAKIAKPKSPRK